MCVNSTCIDTVPLDLDDEVALAVLRADVQPLCGLVESLDDLTSRFSTWNPVEQQSVLASICHQLQAVEDRARVVRSALEDRATDTGVPMKRGLEAEQPALPRPEQESSEHEALDLPF